MASQLSSAFNTAFDYLYELVSRFCGTLHSCIVVFIFACKLLCLKLPFV